MHNEKVFFEKTECLVKAVKKCFLKKLRLCLVTIFVFYFQKLVFGNIKEKQFSCIFEIKNMFGYLKLKKMVF